MPSQVYRLENRLSSQLIAFISQGQASWSVQIATARISVATFVKLAR